MEIFDGHIIWVFIIASGVFGIFKERWDAKKHIKLNPELTKGYNRYLLWNLILIAPPYALVAYGMISGQTPNLAEFFKYDSGNWIVQLNFAYLISVQIFLIWWFYFYDGVSFYLKHAGIRDFTFNGLIPNVTVKSAKIVFFFEKLLLFIFVGAYIYFDLFSYFE